MKTVLVLAPHPDDETLGCGASLLRWRGEGADIHWLIVTAGHEDIGFTVDDVARRDREIGAVSAFYGFASTHRLDLPAATLDALPLLQIIDKVAAVVKEVRPDTVLLPFRGDSHSDHPVVFKAGAACTKTFRFPFVRTVLVYETISETDFSCDDTPFRPNVFVDISPYLDKKLQAMRLYRGEYGEPPFPRNMDNIRAWATARGAQAGCLAAEAFMLLKEIR